MSHKTKTRTISKAELTFFNDEQVNVLLFYLSHSDCFVMTPFPLKNSMKRTFSRLAKTVVRSRTARSVAGTKLSIGTDLVWIPGVEQSVQQFGQRFLQRVFTLRELGYCHNGVNGAFRFDRLAARFAAKEAVMKLLRPSKDEVLPWQSIEIVADENGAPAVLLAPELRRRYQQSGIYQIVLSLSHDHEYATASAIAVPVAVI